VKFERRFLVKAPLDEVVEFHRHASALEKISPPFPPVQILEAPDPLVPGAKMTMRLWLGPVPVLWEAELEEIDGYGFADRQVRGPFASWRHQHRFEEAPEGAWVVDHIEARLSSNPFAFVAGLSMWVGLPALFRFRTWKTRRLLESNEGSA